MFESIGSFDSFVKVGHSWTTHLKHTDFDTKSLLALFLALESQVTFLSKLLSGPDEVIVDDPNQAQSPCCTSHTSL